MKYKKKAIETGWSCPHCNADGVESMSSPEMTGITVEHRMVCLSCEKEWGEVYQLIDLKE